jgi:hypothetical protein
MLDKAMEITINSPGTADCLKVASRLPATVVAACKGCLVHLANSISCS